MEYCLYSEKGNAGPECDAKIIQEMISCYTRILEAYGRIFISIHSPRTRRGYNLNEIDLKKRLNCVIINITLGLDVSPWYKIVWYARMWRVTAGR